MLEAIVRAGEVVAMSTGDVDLTRGLAIVRRGKGRKGRPVPFGPQTGRAIDRYLRLRRSHRLAATAALWLGDRGKGLSYDGLYAALKYRAELAGIPDFHPHVTRHTAAQRWLSAEGSEDGLMAVAGWTRRDMIDRYTRATASERARGGTPPSWLRMGLRDISRQVRHDPGCTAHSFGQVQKCLLAEPCRGLQRSLFKISDNKGRTIVVSVALVRMPSAVSARRLKRLVDKPGTGNISPIADDALVGVWFTGKHYASRRTGSVVVIVEATAESGQPSAAVLNSVAEVAAEFPSL